MTIARVWRVNRIVNMVALLATLSLIAWLAVTFVRSLVGDASTDPHGYARIFSVLAILAMLVPLMLLGVGRRQLRRQRRSGLVLGMLAGAVFVLYGAAISGAVRWIGVGLGVLLAGVGAAGLVATRAQRTIV
jgi:cell division protein FtsW (lipid II flippase)